MENNSRVRGIIYKISLSGQSDKIISLINEKGEKVVLSAKGIRKLTSKRAQFIEIGNYIDAKVVNGYGMGILTDLKVIKEYKSWKRDHKKIFYLQLICEILNNFIFEENQDIEQFRLLKEVLEVEEIDPEFMVACFSLKFLDITGHLPQLNLDIRTMEQINSNNFSIDPAIVGYCKDEDKEKNDLESRVYKAQRFIIENEIGRCKKITLSEEESKLMLRIHLNWIEITLDKKLKSREVIRDMNL